MARHYFITRTKTNELMGKLDLVVEGDLSRVIGNHTASTFVLKIDKNTPANWEELVEPQMMSVWVVDSFFKEPLWAGEIVDIPRSTLDEVTLDCISFEGNFVTRFMRDCVYNDMDAMTIFRKIIEDNSEFMDSDPDKPHLGSWLTGIGLEYDIPTSGVQRSVDYKAYNDVTVFDALTEWATSNQIEWTIAPKFVDAVNRTGFRKVVVARHKYLGTVTDRPNHQFLLSGMQNGERTGDIGGNVSAFSYSEATNAGAYATHFRAIGDGSGALRTQSKPVRNSEREKAGYPRVEVKKSFSGVTWTEDAQVLGENEAQRLFTHQDIITLDAHDNGATNLQSMELGDSVLVRIKAPSIDRTKVLRLVGWTVGNDSHNFSPTLAELGADPYKFKRAVDPLSPDPEPSTGGTNPNENGVYVPSPDGGAWTIDPENGFGMVDENGDWSGGGFDGGGGMASGTSTRYIVQSYNSLTKWAVLREIGTDSSSEATRNARNTSGMPLAIGDYVNTVVSTEDVAEGADPIIDIITNEQEQYPDPVMYKKWRVNTRYPINVQPFRFTARSSFVDRTNAFQKGSDCVIALRSEAGMNSFYNPVTGQMGSMSAPYGYTEVDYGTYVWNGKGYRAFLDSGGQVRMFEHSPSTIGGWKLIPGLPATPNAWNVGGYWTAESAGKEIYTRPTIVTARIANGTYGGSHIPGYASISLEFSVFVLSASGASMTPIHTYTKSVLIYGWIQNQEIPQGAKPVVRTYSHNSHIYVEARVTGTTGDASLWGFFYADLDDPTMKMHDLGSVQSYMGVAHSGLRVSEDGLLYAAYGVIGGVGDEALMVYRGLTDAESTNISMGSHRIQRYGSSTDWQDIQVQRDRTTSRFYVIAHTRNTGYYGGTAGSYVWEVYSTNSSVGEPLAPLGYYAGFITRPQQMPNGDEILFYLQRDDQSHELHLISPNDDVWPDFQEPDYML